MTRAEERAYMRQSILQDIARRRLTLHQYAEAYNSGRIGRQDGVMRLSVSTLYRWQKNYEEGGVEAIAPRYKSPKDVGARTLESQDKQLIQAYYLDENRPTLAHILRLIKRYHGRTISSTPPLGATSQACLRPS